MKELTLKQIFLLYEMSKEREIKEIKDFASVLYLVICAGMGSEKAFHEFEKFLQNEEDFEEI